MNKKKAGDDRIDERKYIKREIINHRECDGSVGSSQGTRYIWWKPQRIGIYKGKWRTVSKGFILDRIQAKTISLSPIGEDGLVYFIAFDVDSNNKKDINDLLAYLPEPYFISVSGLKGWHVWVFPDKPVQIEIAVQFAKIIKEKSGVECEIFPNSKRSKCIKWLLSHHPITGVVESFIDNVKLKNVRYDTAYILREISSGSHRVPSRAITETVEMYKTIARKKPIERKGSALASDPKIAFGLAKLFNRDIVKIGESFQCFLPGHADNNPSAAFYTADNGTIVYHDFHHIKHGTPEFLTLGEVYAAVVTKKISKWQSFQISRWLAKLAIRIHYDTESSRTLKKKLIKLSDILLRLGIKKTTGEYISAQKEVKGFNHKDVDLQASTFPHAALAINQTSRTHMSIYCDLNIINKVWLTFCNEAIISTFANFEEIKLSSRFLSKEAKVPLDKANRAINFLASIGVIEKVHGSGGMRGNRYIIKDPEPKDVKERYYKLFPDCQIDLKTFSYKYVVDMLGQDIANQVFSRSYTSSLTKGNTKNKTLRCGKHIYSDVITYKDKI